MAWTRADACPQTKEPNMYVEAEGQEISINREALTVRTCNGYDTIQSLQPHSLFNIFVYLYLLRDFSPFTTTPVLVPLLLHNRKRSSVLVGLKVLGFLHLVFRRMFDECTVHMALT